MWKCPSRTCSASSIWLSLSPAIGCPPKNFACVKPHIKDLQVWARLDPSSVVLEEGFTKDVSQLGHAGTGDLEIRLRTAADLERSCSRCAGCCAGRRRTAGPAGPSN